MIGERTEAGWEVHLRPPGAGRWCAAAFLLLWLCFWVVGKVFVAFVIAPRRNLSGKRTTHWFETFFPNFSPSLHS